MDEQQQQYQFMTILSESHPGLTFEEYRDSCIFILFYQYLCLRYDEYLDENYKLHMMVRMAIRGKLQMDSFLLFIERATPFFHMASRKFTLTELSFYKQLKEVDTLEKQKSYARFFRKLIKKIDSWEDKQLLLSCYPAGFEILIKEFASMKKETSIPNEIQELYLLFSKESNLQKERKIFHPEFRYGSLLRKMLSDCQQPFFCGYENSPEYIEYMSILCFMYDIPEDRQYFTTQKQWLRDKTYHGDIDTVCIYMPEGVEAGLYLSDAKENEPVKELINLKTKGELPFLLSAFPILKKNGDILAILPSALLYREGREASVRKYFVDELNCLDTVILLPDSVFPSLGQQEVFLYLKKDRQKKDIMFFDCSGAESFDEDLLKDIRKAWRGRKSISGFCNCVTREEIAENEYNLNLPRYIKKPIGIETVDIGEKKRRIAEIDAELKLIDEWIEMYRRDLELDALVDHN